VYEKNILREWNRPVHQIEMFQQMLPADIEVGLQGLEMQYMDHDGFGIGNFQSIWTASLTFSRSEITW
jgi:hypothetical protein